jgi:ATP-binding cassette subfamily F protein uup
MVSYLQAENISRRIGDRIIFEKIFLNINKGDKIALIAVNGAGKSSLLDILAGTEIPDSGSLSLRKGITISYLRQYPLLNESNSIIDELFTTESDIVIAIKNYERCLSSENEAGLQAALQKMDDLKAWDYEVAVKQILFRLKLTDINAPVYTLSGGQKKRLALAKVLVNECDLIILDEPTNHLDLDMIEWLEDYLIRSGRTILMVTHDRYFLDRICNSIMELTTEQLYSYQGNYEYYLEKRQEKEQSERAVVEKARNLMRTELDWMRRMPKARRHKAKSRIDSFYELKDKAVGKTENNSISINVNIARMGKKILEIKNVSKSYGDKNLINDFSYSFNRFEKVGLIGRNGTGKTTLLNIITGSVSPDSGTVERGETIVYGYYRQEGIQFDDDMTVIDAARKISETVRIGEGNEVSVSQFLNYFLFTPDRQYTFIRKLSGGEKRRLYLLTVLMQNPNFLILDEPTNDLDIITLNILEEYLSQFRGCVVIVSHDRYFMDKVVDHIFEYKGDGIIKDFPGNYTQLRNREEEENEQDKDSQKAKPVKQELKDTSSVQVPAKGRKKGLTFSEKKEFDTLTFEIAKLESEKKKIEEEMNNGTHDHISLHSLSSRHGEIIQLLDEKEFRWLELSEKV